MVVDLIMPAAIAKWAILAPIFIPLLIRLDVTPQTVLAAYRVADSPLNVVTPLMAYFPLIVVFVQRYNRHAGIGTVVSLMLPYVIVLSIAWTLFFVAWYLLGIPWGPGAPVHPVADGRQHDHVRRPRRGRGAVRRRQGCRSRSWPCCVALSLWATGVLSLEDALAGFGDPTVLFIASLFVVSEALEASGVTAWVGQQLVARVGGSRTRLIVLTMALAAVLTALLNVNGAVAALVPVAVVLAVRTGRSPSQLMLPLAFAAHAGSLLALTGTPVNVIVSDAAPRRRRVRLLLVRAGRRAADAGDGRDRRAVRGAAAAGADAALDRARLQRARADADRAVRARPSGGGAC